MCRAERVPQREDGVVSEVAGLMNVQVASAITAVNVHEQIRRQHRVIKGGVERGELRGSAAADGDLTEFCVPLGGGFGFYSLERLVIQLRREIQQRAVCIDRRNPGTDE